MAHGNTASTATADIQDGRLDEECWNHYLKLCAEFINLTQEIEALAKARSGASPSPTAQNEIALQNEGYELHIQRGQKTSAEGGHWMSIAFVMPTNDGELRIFYSYSTGMMMTRRTKDGQFKEKITNEHEKLEIMKSALEGLKDYKIRLKSLPSILEIVKSGRKAVGKAAARI